jgi:hypothetical protein
MKTTLFFGLLLLSALFTACDAEREAELIRPNPEVLREAESTSTATQQTEVEVFESVGTMRNPDEDRPGYYHIEVNQDPPLVVSTPIQPQQKKQVNPAQNTEQ